MGTVAIPWFETDPGPGPDSNPLGAFLEDGAHPGTVIQGILANVILEALRSGYGEDVSLFDESEILGHAGISDGRADTLLPVIGSYSRFVLAATSFGGDGRQKYRPPRPSGREGRMFPPEQFKNLWTGIRAFRKSRKRNLINSCNIRAAFVRCAATVKPVLLENMVALRAASGLSANPSGGRPLMFSGSGQPGRIGVPLRVPDVERGIRTRASASGGLVCCRAVPEKTRRQARGA